MITPLDQRPQSDPYSGLTLNAAKRFLAQQFREAGLESPDLDARLLVMTACGLSHAGLIARGTELMAPPMFEALSQYAQRRLCGEPIDHILGYREFYGRRFAISQDVLSPRPETEGLVDTALTLYPITYRADCLDLGTGSGAIIISLLAERPLWQGLACDISETALNIAKDNAQALGVEDRLAFQQGSWFELVQAKYDLILSNPPYIDAAHMAALPTEVAGYDPALALAGGEDGLSAYRVLAAQACDYLKPGGWLVLEIGYDQKTSVTALLENHGFTAISCEQDLSGHDRIIKAKSDRE